MSMRFHLFGSSSQGNCALIETADAHVLLDAGFSGRQICQHLARIHKTPADINAVLLTHEHHDHAQGVRGLSRYEHIRFYATRGTAEAVQRRLPRPVHWTFIAPGARWPIGCLNVECFAIPHDAYEPVGFVLSCGEVDSLFHPHRSLAWVTDLGYVPRQLPARIENCDLLILEANHEDDLLEASQRPWPTKQRIRGRHGHLSNEAAHQFLQGIPRPRWRQVILAHLSQECNDPARVRDRFGLRGPDYDISIALPDQPLPVVDLHGF